MAEWTDEWITENKWPKDWQKNHERISFANIRTAVDLVEELDHTGDTDPSRRKRLHMVSKPLPLRVEPKFRETIPSFLSRMAAVNGVSASNFALDMGFSLKKIVQLDEVALDYLTTCSGLTGAEVEELVSWTGKVAGDVRMVFRDEVLGSRSLRNPVIRGCPHCLREDAEIEQIKPLAHMTMRGDWQFREVDLCIKHSHPLVELWERNSLTERYDLSTRFSTILDDIQERRLERPRVEISPYDHWLDIRLRTGVDDTWLSGNTLHAATTFCTLLGTELLRLEDSSDLDQFALLRRARALGFQAASQGEAKINGALDQLAKLAEAANAGPQKAFGRMFVDFGQAHLEKVDFAPFRKILRDCIIRHWPVAAGETVLGIVQPERKLHSIITASQETGIGQSLIEQFLVHAGALGSDDDRPAARKTFEAEKYAELLAEIPALVGPIAMQQAMGATKGEFASLAQSEILVRRIPNAKVKSPWRISDGVALVDELHELAMSIEAIDESWERIQDAKNRTNLSLAAIIKQVRVQKLQLGRRVDLEGYTAFCVLKEEIDAMKTEEVERTGGPMMTAAAFGRSVGIRTQGWFERLSSAGHTPATRRPHPKYGGDWIYASIGDIEEFHKRFVTSKTIRDDFGHYRRFLLKKLNRFAPNGEDYGPLFLREDVEALLHQDGWLEPNFTRNG